MRRVRSAFAFMAVLAVATSLSGVAVAQAPPEAASTGWRQVTTGSYHTCAIRTSGRLYCWGDNSAGQLGTGDLVDRARPTEVAGGGSDWIQVIAGNYNTCARRGPSSTAGRLYCWGPDREGQLGNGSVTGRRTTPTQVAGSYTDWSGVSVGFEHVCARRAGRLFCWGAGQLGALGDGQADAYVHIQEAPTAVLGGFSDWTSVSAGDDFTCGRRNAGRLYCWGYGPRGELGSGDRYRIYDVPQEVSGGRTDWTLAAVSAAHSCGVQSNGGLLCWGDDRAGQLGDGANGPSDPGFKATPSVVRGGFSDWVDVRAGGAYNWSSFTRETTCARRTTGRLYCWGEDRNGQLGNGAGNADRYTPGEVAGGATNWAGFDVDQHVCALKTDSSLWCWGSNWDHELGVGSTADHLEVPTPVLAP